MKAPEARFENYWGIIHEIYTLHPESPHYNKILQAFLKILFSMSLYNKEEYEKFKEKNKDFIDTIEKFEKWEWRKNIDIVFPRKDTIRWIINVWEETIQWFEELIEETYGKIINNSRSADSLVIVITEYEDACWKLRIQPWAGIIAQVKALFWKIVK